MSSLCASHSFLIVQIKLLPILHYKSHRFSHTTSIKHTLYIHITLYIKQGNVIITRYYLGNAYSVDPLMQCSDIVTAQILDVL